MSGEVWPKEEQRLRNGACGQVPLTASCDDDESFEKKRRQAAIDTEVDFLWLESIACDHVGYGGFDRWTEVDRAAMLHGLVQLDGARAIATAIRNLSDSIVAAILDAGTENAGATDSAGTVLGAVLAECLPKACKCRPCRRGT